MRPQQNTRLWLLVLAFGLLGALTMCLSLVAHPGVFVAVAIVVVALVLVVAISYVRITIEDHTEEVPRSYGSIDALAVDPLQIDYFVSPKSMNALDYPQLFSFVAGMLFPERVFKRISESVESYHRSTVVRSTFTFVPDTTYVRPSTDEELESSGAASIVDELRVSESGCDFVVPLLIPPKGEMLDGLRATREGAARISTLDSQRQLVFSLAVIRGFALLCGTSTLTEYLASIESDVSSLMARSQRPQDVDIDDVLSRVNSLPVGAPNAPALVQLGELVRALLLLNPVCVTLPASTVASRRWPRSFRLGVERRFVANVDDSPGSAQVGKLARFLDGVRLGVGVRLNRIYFPLTNASRSKSYHAEIIGPVGTYLAVQAIIPAALEDGETPATVELDAELQQRLGQRRAHLYVRSIGGNAPAYFGTQFFERAPGSMLFTTLSSLAAAIVVTVLAFREVSVSAGTQPDFSLLPALIALPIGVAALAGVEGSRSLNHPSLLSRGITFVTIAVALASLLATTLPSLNWLWHPHIWVVVLVVSWASFLSGAASWFIRLSIEHRFVTQQVD